MADQIAGNVLGAARAEADLRMLDSAFIETADFKALLETQDFNFVVGRRGTGKSALHLKLTRRLHGGGVICLSDRPEEFEVLEAQAYLAKTTDSYRTMRSMLRVAWRAHLLLWVLAELIDHYKLAGKESGKDVAHHAQVHARILRHNSPGRVAGILAAAIDATDNNPQRVPGAIATRFALSSLEDVIRQALADINRPALIFLDGLDEGWTPDVGATAVLGGLAAAVSDLDERKVGVHGTLLSGTTCSGPLRISTRTSHATSRGTRCVYTGTRHPSWSWSADG